MKIVIYDPTDKKLSWIWKLGSWLYYMLGVVDLVIAEKTIQECFKKLPLAHEIEEIQFWCHGWPGYIVWNGEFKNASVFNTPLLKENGLLWFRSCSTMTGVPGRNFAEQVATFQNGKVAAHTFNIGNWGLQSGLRVHDPKNPKWDWPLDEGIAEGEPTKPLKLLWSGPFKPATVTALHSSIPKDKA